MAPDLRLNRALHELLTRFKACPVDVAELRALLQPLPREEFPIGASIYREGEPSECLHLLLDGTVRVSAGSQKTVLTTISAPTVLGHLGVLTGLPRSASIDTVSPAVLIRIGQAQVRELSAGSGAGNQAFRRLMLATMGGLMSDTNQQLQELVTEYGESIPRGAARLQGEEPPRPPKGGGRSGVPASPGHAADRLSSGFDPDLLDELENIRLVQTEDDRRHKYKR